MSPTGNSNHSDVDSATSAAGYQLSPERNACFFGSPTFDLPPDEMKDLQLVLDQGSETSGNSGTRRNSLALDQQSPSRSQHGPSSSHARVGRN